MSAFLAQAHHRTKMLDLFGMPGGIGYRHWTRVGAKQRNPLQAKTFDYSLHVAHQSTEREIGNSAC